MNDDEKNETGRSVHQSVRTLEEAVEHFLADVEAIFAARDAEKDHRRGWHSLESVHDPLHKLRAAFEKHMGRAPAVPRSPYRREVKIDASGRRDNEVRERHESYGLVHLSRVQGYTRLFGSSVRHGSYFQLRIYRGQRIVREHGEHFWNDGRVPIVEIALSPAQFVEMITAQNMGEGVPCTISAVEGVSMDPTPDDAGSEVKLIVELFQERLRTQLDGMRGLEKGLNELLAKKTLNKEDREQIRETVRRLARLFDDSAPWVTKLVGEHAEKIVAKGKMDIEAFIQLALHRAGIQAIKDAGGTLLLGTGEEQKR